MADTPMSRNDEDGNTPTAAEVATVIRLRTENANGGYVLLNQAEAKYVADLLSPVSEKQAIPEGMVLVSKKAVAIAWSIAKDRRDRAAEAKARAEDAERDLQVMKDGGMAQHLPTLKEVQAAWRNDG